MSHNTPPLMLPYRNVPMIDPVTAEEDMPFTVAGLVTPPWYRFFADLCSRAEPLEQLTVKPSPFQVYTNHPGYFLIIGAATNVALTRAKITIPSLGVTAGFIPVAAGDALLVTYAVLPKIWFIPEGVPA